MQPQPLAGQRVKTNDRKPRDAVKSPSMRRPKEIQYVRLRLVQQYFQGIELRKDETKADEAAPELPQPAMYKGENAESPEKQEDQPAAENEAKDEAVETKGKEEADAEVDDHAADEDGNAEKAAEETAVDERGEEAHEEYNQSQAGEDDAGNTLYDPTEIMVLEINSRSKARCLQRVILEKSNMKKANVLLFRQVFVKDAAGAASKPVPANSHQVQQLQMQGLNQAQIQQ